MHVASEFEELLGFFYPKKRFSSPFRETKDPNCCFYKDKKGIWMFHDFVDSKSIDIFSMYMIKNNCSFYDSVVYYAEKYELVDELTALGMTFKSYKISSRSIINQQLQSSNLISVLNNFKHIIKLKKLEEETPIEYTVDFGQWESHHISFWNDREIPYHKLVHTSVQVVPIETVYMNGNKIWEDTEKSPIFGYLDGTNLLQIYRPFADKKNKFRNINNKPLFLDSGKRSPIILSKGYKDSILLLSSGMSVIASTGEGRYYEDEFLLSLSKNKTIHVLFDNDKAGIKASDRIEKFLIEKGFKVKVLYCPEPYKDYDAMVKTIGLKSSKKILKKLIYG